MIKGNIEGIKKVYLNQLEDLFQAEFDRSLLVGYEILDVICRVSGDINREISIYINRRGRIVDITVGDHRSVSLEALTEKRDERGLCGIRCVHTHPSGDAELSSVDITALINMKLDCMAAIGVTEGKPKRFSFGYIKVEEGRLMDRAYMEGPYDLDEMRHVDFLSMIADLESRVYDSSHVIDSGEKERVLIVGGINYDEYSSEESLDELEELVETAGATVVHRAVQNRRKIDTATYIGSGKASDISLMRQSVMASTVVFDDELSGAQIRNLEEIMGCKVIDRTTLILDIFAQRAKSREGKLQVELAQLKFRLPRLLGYGNVLSRTGGGIGTRGPGEKKLEVDKRHIRNRIHDLERELQNIKKTRSLQREKRIAREIPVVSVAGYTNAGKSTLRNKLCEMHGVEKEKVLEADMLFATLDTTTRIVELPSGKDVLISDTVGFIRKLPHDLIDAFKSTLEEVTYSNLVLHVVDASNKNAVTQIKTVEEVLSGIGAGKKDTLLVLNKIDLADEDDIMTLRSKYPEAIEVSAKQGTNLESLLEIIQERVYERLINAKLLVPYSEGSVVSYLHDNKCVTSEEYQEAGIYMEITTTEDIVGRVKKFIV